MRLRNALALLTAISAVAVSGTAVAVSGTAAASTRAAAVEVAVVNGSGCPNGAKSAVVEGSDLRLTYDGFVARTGPSIPSDEFRVNCQVAVLIRAYEGHAFTITEARYDGDAALGSGTYASRHSNYYLQASTADEFHSNAVLGPNTDGWSGKDTPVLVGPCGADKILNINTDLRVYASTGTAQISLRDSSAHIGWKAC
jgi:Domain of unknown function (DUF4360)